MTDKETAKTVVVSTCPALCVNLGTLISAFRHLPDRLVSRWSALLSARRFVYRDDGGKR
jgi:hypothetical protein